jgi:hypothetical protein
MTEVLKRSTELRADPETGTVEGIAVPWGKPISIGGIREQFARGSIGDVSGTKLYWQHGEIIGRILSGEDREDGFHVKAQISDTALGRDARTLIRDGAVDSFSVGFVPLEEREETDGTITRTKVQLREVSAVSFPAYADARILSVRTETTSNALERSTSAMPEATAVTEIDLTEVRETVEELTRRVDTISVRDREAEPTVDTRSAAEIVKALIARDDTTTNRVNAIQTRAYTGGTSADSPVMDAWVGDLTRIFDASSGVLASIFASDVLPSTGNNIEFAELATNSIALAEQAAEGDDLAFGKVTLGTRTAPVKTYGGYTTLSRQEIERSTLPILQRSLEALAMAGGVKAKAVLRAHYEATYAAQAALAVNAGVVVLGSVLGSAGYSNWSSAVIDAAIRFDAMSLPLEYLVTSASVFKSLDALKDSANRPIFDRTGSASNSGGSLSLVGLRGNLAGVNVVLDPGATGDKAAFVNGSAIRQYLSPVVSLQDDSIINLSKDFSAYRYGAVAAEMPGAIVPIKLAAS